MTLSRPVPFDAGLHATDGFSCGREALDAWLQLYAGQNERRDAARTFVVVEPSAGRVVGYYTLVASSIVVAEATAEVARGISRHFPIPVALLARLAVDEAQQGAGIGGALLLDAIERVLRTSTDAEIRAIVVDAIDDQAMRFYERFGFTSLTDDRRKLMVTVAAARRRLA